MLARPILLLLAACALVAGRPVFSQSATDVLSKWEPLRSSAWTTVTYPEDSAPHGKLMFARFCEACHGAAVPTPFGSPPGPGGPMGRGPMVPPGTAELQVKYGTKEMAELEKRADLSPDAVVYFVRHGTGVMPPIRKTELSDADLKSIAEYLAHRQ